MSSLIKKSLALAAVGFSLTAASLSAQASGMPITLPTAAIDADSTFSFSKTAALMMERQGITVSGLGNAKAVTGGGLAFDMPVTKVSAAINLLPPNLSPISGEAMGSALGFAREEAAGFVLANFGLDFKRNVLMADFITNGTTTKGIDVFNFKVSDDLKISMDGGLSLDMAMNHMMLTAGAKDRFAAALALEPYAVAALGSLDFGSLDVDINPTLRMGISDKAFTASAVPEAPSVLAMMLGMIGLGFVSNRRKG